MTGVLSRIEAVFVAPADGAAVPEAPAAVRGAGSTLAVLAPAARARSLGAAAAMAAAGRGVALLACWRTAQRIGPRVPAAPAGRGLVRTLAARGIEAVTTGRLVVVELGDDEGAAIETLERCDAVAPGAVVTALGGARGDGWQTWLLSCDRVLVAAHEQETAELAAHRLVENGVAAESPATWPGVTACRLALAGLALPGGLAASRAAP